MAFKAVPVVAAKVTATQTNFPVFIKPSALTGWGSITLAEAQSSRWYSDEAKTTELAREIVSADEIHVKVPSLTTTTTIYVDYDGVRSDYGVADTYGRNATWNNSYSGVYHFTAHDTITNSTGGSNGTGNSTVSGDIVAGPLGNAIELLSNGDYCNLPTGQLNSWTLQYVYKKNGNPGGENAGLERATSVGTFTNMQITRITTGSAVNFQGRNGTGAQNFTLNSTGTVGNNAWRWISAACTTGDQKVLIDGSVDVSGTVTHGNNTLATNFFLNRTYDSIPRYALATYAEVRISSVRRADSWITTEYNNQSNVGAFWGTVTDIATVNSNFFAMM